MSKFLLFILATVSITASAQERRALDSSLRVNFAWGSKGVEYWDYLSSWPIKKLTTPYISKALGGKRLYKVYMTNTICWPEDVDCVVMYDPSTRNATLLEPILYSTQYWTFLQLMIGVKLPDKLAVRQFAKELQEILLIGYIGKFTTPVFHKYGLKFDLIETVFEAETFLTFDLIIINKVLFSIALTYKSGKTVHLMHPFFDPGSSLYWAPFFLNVREPM